MKYYGFFKTAEGTYNLTGYEFTNKRTACKDMRAIAYGNCLFGSTANWCVCDENDNIIKEGKINK